MRIVSIEFGKNAMYSQMGKTLRNSARINSPNAQFEIRKVENFNQELAGFLKHKGIKSHDANNALKTKVQKDIVNEAEDGELLCLIDLDTMITGDLTTVEEFEFDLAVTDKEGKQQRAPINSGVLFVRVSDKTKKWFSDWYGVVEGFLAHPANLQPIKKIHLGINQSSLSVLMARPHDLNILKLPCRIWNSTTVTWPQFNEDTKVVHILGSLRSSIFRKQRPPSGKIMKLTGLWKKFEKETQQV